MPPPGVSGPAIYRYFKSKHELLTVLIEEAAIAWRAAVDEVLNTDAPPLVMLENLIDAAVVLQLENGNLRGVLFQELRSLDDDARRRLARTDRVTMAEWVHLLCEVRPSLTDDEAARRCSWSTVCCVRCRCARASTAIAWPR